MNQPFIAVLMGSQSDWEVLRKANDTLAEFGIANEARALSAHRTPDELEGYVKDAEKRGCIAFIAGAGGAAHLAGVIAAKTMLPVLAVPMPSKHLQGLDSLLSMVQMPRGIPVATFAIGEAGAVNAALFCVAMQAVQDKNMRDKLKAFREKQAEKVLAVKLTPPPAPAGPDNW